MDPCFGPEYGVFAALLDALPANAVLLDEHGTVVLINDGWREFAAENGSTDLRYSVGENYLAVCRRAAAAGDPIAAHAAEGLEQLLAGKDESFSLPYPCHGPDKQRWFRLLAKRFRCSGASGVLLLHIDITSHHLAHERLRATEERQRLLLDANPVPSWVFDLETRGFLAVNDAAVRRYGYSKEDFLRMTLDDIRPASELARLRDTIQLHPDGAYIGGSKHQLRDGSLIDVEIHSHPVRYESRAACLVLAIDVTDRKRASEQIRQQAALIDEAHDAIIVRDLGNRITFWSRGAARLYGWTAEEAVGRRLDELLQMPAPVFEQALQVLLRHGSWAGESSKSTKSGRRVVVHSSWTLLRDESENPKSILTFDSDLTHQKELEDQLFRVQRLQSLGTLAGGIAHDFNNLLAPILMGVSLLKANASEIAQREEKILTTIESAAHRGAHLVRQILSFARGVSADHTAVDLVSTLDEIVALAASTFPKDITVREEFAPDLWPVHGERTQLEQVIMNLAINARDAMPHGGTLTFRARNASFAVEQLVCGDTLVAGDYVVIEVADTGTGMSAEVLARMFEPFFTTKPQGKGTGLGLATVKEIIRSHRGFLDVQSEVGAGTSFQVILPAITCETPL